MPSIPSIKKERVERLFRWKQEGVKAASAYEAKEQATRLLTAKLRAERLAREAIRPMSAFGTKRTCHSDQSMSAVGGKADIGE